jgi:hypothetical protein
MVCPFVFSGTYPPGVAITLGLGEPEAGPWRVEPLSRLVPQITEGRPCPPGRPLIVAVDGRGAGGKTTLAERLRALTPGAQVVHTDDIAWWHSRFGWDDLMISGVLEPLLRGEAAHYQPPAWAARGRTGHLDVPADAPMVVIEGVGASRRELAHLIDAAIWVQSDFVEAERRGILRDGGDEEAVRGWHEWMAEELPFLAADKPWERADVIVGSSNQIAHNPEVEVAIATAFEGMDRSNRSA